MKPIKQTVYLPVSEFNSSERAICTIGIPDVYGDKVVEKEGYFFTPEQLNQYTANAIQQALETAAEKAMIEQKGYFQATPEECLKGIEIYDDNVSDRPSFIAFLNKQSITNTFEETFKKFKV